MGEDPAAFDELLARVNAAVQPVNIIEEILINDFVFLEWEVLRGRRLKWSVMQAIGRKALQEFLVKQLESNYALHEEHFNRDSPDDSRTGVNIRVFSGLPARQKRGSDGYHHLGQLERWSRR